MSNMVIDNLFSTPVYKTSLNFNKEKLVDYSLKCKQNNSGRLLSNSGGWQSNPISDKIDLFDDILEHVNKFSQQLNIKTIQKFNQIWLNINEYKDFNTPHIHLNALFSGVLYLKTNKDSGKLVFNHGNNHFNHCWDNIDVIKNDNNNSPSYEFIPQDCDLYIFPAWAEHYVEPNLSDEQRISLSFDTVGE